jgi:hypothetical protein
MGIFTDDTGDAAFFGNLFFVGESTGRAVFLTIGTTLGAVLDLAKGLVGVLTDFATAFLVTTDLFLGAAFLAATGLALADACAVLTGAMVFLATGLTAGFALGLDLPLADATGLVAAFLIAIFLLDLAAVLDKGGSFPENSIQQNKQHRSNNRQAEQTIFIEPNEGIGKPRQARGIVATVAAIRPAHLPCPL